MKKKIGKKLVLEGNILDSKEKEIIDEQQNIEKEEIFEKKDIIYNDNLGVCRVDEVTKLSAGKSEPILYYVLHSIFNKEKKAYVPVYNHNVVLRKLISLDEAENLSKDENFKKMSENIQGEVKYVLSKK